ncbi:uncharacterized protein LJ206_010778 [Theristicus caerulescens]
MANQSWSLVQQEPQHLVEDFSAPRETTYFHPPYPLGSFVRSLEIAALCPYSDPEIFPRTHPATDLASDLKSQSPKLSSGLQLPSRITTRALQTRSPASQPDARLCAMRTTSALHTGSDQD